MIYECLIAKNGLTKGKLYKEKMPNPCAYNAAVRNDDGRVVFVPRKEYFRVVLDG